MPPGLMLGIGRTMLRKRKSSHDILPSKRVPRDYWKGNNWFSCTKGGYVAVPEKLLNSVVLHLADFKLKPLVAQRRMKTMESGNETK